MFTELFIIIMSETFESLAGKKIESSTEHAKKAIDAAASAGRVVGETVKAQTKVILDAGREHLGAAAHDIGDAAAATYNDLREQAKSKTDILRHRADTFLDDASSYAQAYQSETEAYIRENPLQAVGIALGVGFVLGLLIRR